MVLPSKKSVPVRRVEALLIGGFNDGKRYMVADTEDIVRHTVMDAIPAVPLEGVDTTTVDIKMRVETYHRVPFGLSDGMRRGDFCLYLHESIKMDMFDVVQRLFMGYGRAKGETN